MTVIIALVLALLSPRSDAEALARTAPEPLSVSDAIQHLAAARAAAFVVGVDPDLTSAIAAHESHYESNAVGPERGGLVSCGVGTPTPVAKCDRVSLVDQYVALAMHLREWIDATPDLHTALIGYAGGYHLLGLCAQGPVIIRPGVDACRTDEVFQARAAWIRNERRPRA